MTKHAELAHLFRALKTPATERKLPALADRARKEFWSYEHFAGVLLGTEVSARDGHGGAGRIKTAVPRPQDTQGVRLHFPTLGQEDGGSLLKRCTPQVT